MSNDAAIFTRGRELRLQWPASLTMFLQRNDHVVARLVQASPFSLVLTKSSDASGSRVTNLNPETLTATVPWRKSWGRLPSGLGDQGLDLSCMPPSRMLLRSSSALTAQFYEPLAGAENDRPLSAVYEHIIKIAARASSAELVDGSSRTIMKHVVLTVRDGQMRLGWAGSLDAKNVGDVRVLSMGHAGALIVLDTKKALRLRKYSTMLRFLVSSAREVVPTIVTTESGALNWSWQDSHGPSLDRSWPCRMAALDDGRIVLITEGLVDGIAMPADAKAAAHRAASRLPSDSTQDESLEATLKKAATALGCGDSHTAREFVNAVGDLSPDQQRALTRNLLLIVNSITNANYVPGLQLNTVGGGPVEGTITRRDSL